MKTRNGYLNFDRESAKADLLRYDPLLKHDPRKLEILLLRAELLSRNPLFVRDWTNLDKLPAGSKLFHKKNESFRGKWNVDPFMGVFFHRHEKGPVPIEGIADDDYLIGKGFYLTLKIDLRYSKQEIMRKLDSVIDEHLTIYNEQERMKSELYDYAIEQGEAATWNDLLDKGLIKDHAKPPKALKGNIPADLSDYEKYLRVWELKELKNKSWIEISQTLKLNSQQTARNHHKAACHLIKHGIPGFDAFPQK
jgi:hypothetical protein